MRLCRCGVLVSIECMCVLCDYLLFYIICTTSGYICGCSYRIYVNMCVVCVYVGNVCIITRIHNYIDLF